MYSVYNGFLVDKEKRAEKVTTTNKEISLTFQNRLLFALLKLAQPLAASFRVGLQKYSSKPEHFTA